MGLSSVAAHDTCTTMQFVAMRQAQRSSIRVQRKNKPPPVLDVLPQAPPRLWCPPPLGKLYPPTANRPTIKGLSPLFSAPGTVKIVVSTNVAETSITIDDVTAVIDTGRVKEMRFDAARGIARLQETFVSQVGPGQRFERQAYSVVAAVSPPAGYQHAAAGPRTSCALAFQVGTHASRCMPPHPTLETPCRPLPTQAAAQQRRGRAGRVRPGVCYRLFSRRTWGRMPRDTPPEIARAPLQVTPCFLWIPAFCGACFLWGPACC